MKIIMGLFGDMADLEQRTYKIILRNLDVFFLKKRKFSAKDKSISKEEWPWF